MVFHFLLSFGLVKPQCCGFEENNRQQKMFASINFCNNIGQSKWLCNEKMKDVFIKIQL